MKWTVDPTHSSIEFTVRHMSLTTIRGRFTKFEGEGRTNQQGVVEWIKVVIDTNSLDTAEPQRDAHLRAADFFDVEQYPITTFESTEIIQTAPDRFTVKGNLDMHGVSRPLEFAMSTTSPLRDPWGNLRVGAQAQSALRRKDWGLVWNQVMEFGGVMISDDVWFNVSIQVIPDSDPQYRVSWQLNKPEDPFQIALSYRRERVHGKINQVTGILELLNGRPDNFVVDLDTNNLQIDDITFAESYASLFRMRQRLKLRVNHLTTNQPGIFSSIGELTISRVTLPVQVELENMQLQTGLKGHLSARLSLTISPEKVAELGQVFYLTINNPSSIKITCWFVTEILQLKAEMQS